MVPQAKTWPSMQPTMSDVLAEAGCAEELEEEEEEDLLDGCSATKAKCRGKYRVEVKKEVGSRIGRREVWWSGMINPSKEGARSALPTGVAYKKTNPKKGLHAKLERRSSLGGS